MEIKTFEDLIDWVRQLHAHLAASLRKSAAGHTDERAAALLTYLAAHEEELVRITAEFERQADVKAMRTRLYDYIEHKPISGRKPDTCYANLGYDDICREVFQFHDEVIALYKALASKAEIPEARELVLALQEMEEHEAMRMARQSGSSQDV